MRQSQSMRSSRTRNRARWQKLPSPATSRRLWAMSAHSRFSRNPISKLTNCWLKLTLLALFAETRLFLLRGLSSWFLQARGCDEAHRDGTGLERYICDAAAAAGWLVRNAAPLQIHVKGGESESRC